MEFRFECPYCGDLILKGTTKCPSCRLDLSGFAEKVEPEAVKKTTEQILDEIIANESARLKQKGKRLACPGCHGLLNGDETKCPKCGRAISDLGELLCPICASPVGADLNKCSRCGAQLGKSHLAPEPPQPSPGVVKSRRELELDARLRDLESMIPCPKCKVLIRPGDSNCPKCGAPLTLSQELAQDLLELEAEDGRTQQVETRSAEEALEKLDEIEEQMRRPMRSRKLRAGNVTIVTPSVRPSAKGLSNGVGQINGNGLINGTSKINGVGRINGTGFTNGKSLVNGTGVSNGLKRRDKAIGANRVAFLARWQFLVIVVVVVVVISSFVTMSYLKERGAFSADGDFGDWSGAPMFGARAQSISPNIDILEWSVATDSNHLFFYVKTLGDIMGSQEAQCYYLFVDSDGSASTGYPVESLGADYMLQVEGWNGTVQSTAMYDRADSSDRYDWSLWSSDGSFAAYAKGSELEAEAIMQSGLGQAAKYILLSKDAFEDGAVSHVVSSHGGLLVVTQEPSAAVLDDGIVQSASSVTILTLKFSCEGSGGTVNQISPSVGGASLSTTIEPFSLKVGDERLFDVALDTSTLADGQLVTAEIMESSIESTFASVEIIGEGASAYVGASPSSIVIDGAFADWAGKTLPDTDSAPVANPNVDISEVGNVNASGSSFFYVSVDGVMCAGTFIPATVTRPSGGGGGGVVITKRITAEDFLRIYVDSDKSASTGFSYSIGSKTIGADQMIEVRGLHGRIISTSESDYSSGAWTQSSAVVDAAKDQNRIELSVSSSSLGGSSDIDCIVETTTWIGTGDTAAFNSSGLRALTSSFSAGIGLDDWAVDDAASGAYATAMSYQRKVFYDGTNYWSFYFDGKNTVHKYSTNDGVTWTRMGTVFKTSGVDESSVWYDSANNVVYAVGDTSTASMTVTLQKGNVTPASHNITWATSDATLAVSTVDLAGKNAFICRDTSGYLWLLSSNCTQAQPARYDLTAFKSRSTNSIYSWAYSGQMLASPENSDTVKGSIVPAGSGSNVWAIYAYDKYVGSREYTGTWQATQTTIYSTGSGTGNTINSPPSVVVDSHGVVHVVYGTGRKVVGNSAPSIEYTHNNTGATTFALAVDLDQYIPADVGDFYPTISLDSSTNNLFVFWLRSDATLAGKTVTARKCVSGTWSNLTLGSQTTYTKQYLNSIYSVSGESKICWQWTQNITSPFQARFDKIPEFSHVILPVMSIMAIFAVFVRRTRSRRKDDFLESLP